jgi:hypothetical protein
MDFVTGMHLCGPDMEDCMDNELLDLADRLCTVAGMIMEDHNLPAITTASLDRADKEERLTALGIAAEDMGHLIAAAKVLVRLG